VRHFQICHLFNRLNHRKSYRHIPAISVYALSNKAPGFVINPSDCSSTPVKALGGGLAAPGAALRQFAAVATAHKSGLQSFAGYLCLKTRFQRES
jgi:hypothetical protein